MMLSTGGTGTSPTEHQHCCPQFCWQLQCQKVHAAGAVCRTGTDNHQLTVPAEGQIQDDLATPILQTLTPLGLCPWAPKGPVWHATHQSHAQSGLQPRPQAGSDQSPTQYQACCEEKRSIGEEAWHQQAASEKYWVLKGAPGQTRKEGTASPRNRSQPPVAAAENHSSGNGWESRQPLQEKAQRLVWWKWCKHPKASTSQSPLLYKAPLQARWPCYLDSIQESLQ